VTAVPADAPVRSPARLRTRGRIRVDVRLTDGKGFRRYFPTWEKAAEWIASPLFLGGTPGMQSVHIGARSAFPGGTR
jgi:hypothetical protein